MQTDLTLMRRAGRCPMTGSPTTPAGSASRGPSTASRKRSKTRRGYIAKRCGLSRRLCRDLARKGCAGGVVYPITSHFDVPLMVARGYASR